MAWERCAKRADRKGAKLGTGAYIAVLLGEILGDCVVARRAAERGTREQAATMSAQWVCGQEQLRERDADRKTTRRKVSATAVNSATATADDARGSWVVTLTT